MVNEIPLHSTLWEDFKTWINLSNKANKVWLAFITGATALGFMCFSMLPAFSAWGIMILGLNLGLTLDKWFAPENIQAPADEPLDQSLKGILTGVILFSGLFFAFLSGFTQIAVGTMASLGLSTFFISQCFLAPQAKLNQALRDAVINNNIENVNALLARGADPLECNTENNHCFHLAISNHENSVAILNTLGQHAAQEKVTLKSVLLQFKLFLAPELRTELRHWYNAAKVVFRNRRVENRTAFYNASEQLLIGVSRTLQAIINQAFRYLQKHVESDNVVNRPNQAGNTPSELIDIVCANNPQQAHALKECFRQLPTPEEPSSTQTVMQTAVNYLVLQANAHLNSATTTPSVPSPHTTSATQRPG